MDDLTIVYVDGKWIPEVELLRRGYEPLRRQRQDEDAASYEVDTTRRYLLYPATANWCRDREARQKDTSSHRERRWKR